MPRSALAYNALGETLKQRGRPERARGSTSSGPSTSNPHSRRRTPIWHWRCSRRRIPDAAAGHLDRAIKIFGKSPDAAHPVLSASQNPHRTQRNRKSSGRFEEGSGPAAGFRRSVVRPGAGPKDAAGRGRRIRGVPALGGTGSGERRSRNTVSAPKYLRRGDARRGRAHLRESYRLNPKNQSTLHSLQLALRQDGKLEEAARVKAELAALLPEDRQGEPERVCRTAIEQRRRGSGEVRRSCAAALEKYRAGRSARSRTRWDSDMNFGVAFCGWDSGKKAWRNCAKRPGATQSSTSDYGPPPGCPRTGSRGIRRKRAVSQAQ